MYSGNFHWGCTPSLFIAICETKTWVFPTCHKELMRWVGKMLHGVALYMCDGDRVDFHLSCVYAIAIYSNIGYFQLGIYKECGGFVEGVRCHMALYTLSHLENDRDVSAHSRERRLSSHAQPLRLLTR